MNVVWISRSQCLKKYILYEQKKQSTFTQYKISTIGYSIHKAEKKIFSDLISSYVGAAHGKYFKATTFKLTFFIQHLIKCT